MAEEVTRDHLMASPPIDITSTRGMFGWTVVDSIAIPHIFRQEKKYAPVRVVEQQFVSRYLKAHPHFLNSRPPLISHYVTPAETNLLNEINAVHCAQEYGSQPFTNKDLIVKLSDFEQYFEALKQYDKETNFGNTDHNETNKVATDPPLVMCQGGWIQLNNTVMPYLLRQEQQYVPLAVIKYAAKILTDVSIQGEQMVEEEWEYLNEACRSAGLQFEFSKKSKLIPLSSVLNLSKSLVRVQELPPHNPFLYAEYQYRPHGQLPAAATNPIIDQTPAAASNPIRDQTVMNIKRRIANFRSFTPNLNRPNGLHACETQGNGMQPITANPSKMVNHDRLGWPRPSTPLHRSSLQSRISPTHTQHSSEKQDQFLHRLGSEQGVINRHLANGRSPNVCVTPNGFYNQSEHHTHQKQEVDSNGDQPLDLSNSDKKPRNQQTKCSQAVPSIQANYLPVVNGGTMAQHDRTRPIMKANKRKQHNPTPHSQVPIENTTATSPHMHLPNRNGSASSPVESMSSLSSRGGTPDSYGRSSPKSGSENPSQKAASDVCHEIRRVKFHGKVMSVLTNNQLHLALLEVAVRLFFPTWDIDNFLYTLKEILGVKIFTLNKEEEKAFIRFYGLPTDSLECNKAVRLMDLKNKMQPLEFIFEAKRKKMQQKQDENQKESDKKVENDQKDTSSNESHITNNNRLLYTNGTTEEISLTHGGEDTTNNENSASFSLKRPGSAIVRSGNAKKLNKSLDNTLARLKGIKDSK